MSYIGQGTYTYYAISNATQLFKAEGRKTSVKVALLMTDGIDHPKSPDVQAISEAARSSGISFITIGLSGVANEAKLRLISGDSPGKRVLILNDPRLVDKIREQLVSHFLEFPSFNKLFYNTTIYAGSYWLICVYACAQKEKNWIVLDLCIWKLYYSQMLRLGSIIFK